MPRWHQVAVPSDLAVLLVAVAGLFTVLGRGGRPGIAIHSAADRPAIWANSHVVHALVHLAHLKLTKLLLEKLQIAAAIAHLGVESGANGLIVCLRSHSIGGIDESLLSLNLLVDILDPLIFVHFDGVEPHSSVELIGGREGEEGRQRRVGCRSGV